MRQTWGKSDCRSKTNVSTSNYYLVAQKVATSIISNKAQKRERKLFPLKIEETNLFCHLRQKQATEYNQATKEDIPAPNDVWLKQITPITTVVALTSSHEEQKMDVKLHGGKAGRFAFC